MAAASSTSKDVKKGIINGAGLTVLLTAMFTFLGILFFRSVFPEAKLSLIGMLNALYTSQNSLVSFIIFPLLFAGCLAALISTADSALAPILQSLFYDFRKSRQDFRESRQWKHRYVLLLTVLLFIITIGLYFIVFRILGFNLITWLFTIFSFLIVSAPSIIFAVVAPDDMVRERSSQITAIISIWGGIILAIALSIIGNKLKVIELVQLNSPLAALFGSLCFLILWLRYKAKQRR
jgi:hypothetical protein